MNCMITVSVCIMGIVKATHWTCCCLSFYNNQCCFIFLIPIIVKHYYSSYYLINLVTRTAKFWCRKKRNVAKHKCENCNASEIVRSRQKCMRCTQKTDMRLCTWLNPLCHHLECKNSSCSVGSSERWPPPPTTTTNPQPCPKTGVVDQTTSLFWTRQCDRLCS